jgi:hypothetical protein
MTSKITGGPTEYLFTATVLDKYPVQYFRCTETGFIQTEDPFWLDEAYSSAITSLDLGLVKRNMKLSEIVEKVIGENLPASTIYLDYAGGYGLFTRMMRDKGYSFYHTDKFCENLFAKHFELEDAGNNVRFDLLTAFELFEHLNNPLEEVKAMLKYSDSIFFSTEIVPPRALQSSSDWWYFAPETGQHIAFYTVKALQHIAASLNLKLFTNNNILHLLTSRSDIDPKMFSDIHGIFDDVHVTKVKPGTSKLKQLFLGKHIVERESLLQQDFEHVKNIVSKKS